MGGDFAEVLRARPNPWANESRSGSATCCGIGPARGNCTSRLPTPQVANRSMDRCSPTTERAGLQRWCCWFQATPMHQPWQQFVLESDIVEFAGWEYLPNRPDTAAREIRSWLGRLHAIADLKQLRHRACPSPAQRRAHADAPGWCAISVRPVVARVLSGHVDCDVREVPDTATPSRRRRAREDAQNAFRESAQRSPLPL